MSTITEALAEIKTIGKRLKKKASFVNEHLYRQEKFSDPFIKEGGQAGEIKRERQAMDDLNDRALKLRIAINRANESNRITINGVDRSISEWIVWRRDIAPRVQANLTGMQNSIRKIRQEAINKGAPVSDKETENPENVIININERDLVCEVEDMVETLGQLDGMLSMTNATTSIDNYLF